MRWLRRVLLVAVLGTLGVTVVGTVGATAVGTAPVNASVNRLMADPVATALPVVEHYVALGDSYSSGVGAGGEHGSCGRSARAYPALWAAANMPATFAVAACSGARTDDVAGGQLGALSFATTLVSITIGGNDEGFASIMTDCTLRGTSRCVHEVSAAANDARATLRGKLLALFGSIAVRAPRARVVVLGYPDFYDPRDDCLGLASASRSAIDRGIDLLDAILRSAARTAGFRFADVRGGFAGHEICDGSPWLHAISLFHLSESYHPTGQGQSGGYLPAFTAAARP